MQTRCPHCNTRFRVTQSQVETADGFVRCSVCKQVFNALEVAEQHELQQSLLTAHHSEDIASRKDNREQAELPQTAEADYSDDIAERIQENPAAEPQDSGKTSSPDDLRKDIFDFFDEDADASLQHVVPEKFKAADSSNTPGFISTLLWSTAILLLTASLFIEYAWFNREQLNRIPQLKAWTEKLCQQIECKSISLRSPEKIELVSRNIYSHPNEKNALMVNVTMKNTAGFAQPYPVMQVSFSDIRGGNVAARRFLPSEYLPEDIRSADPEQQMLFEADTNMTFSMEIQDPGKQAMTYEFDFL